MLEGNCSNFYLSDIDLFKLKPMKDKVSNQQLFEEIQIELTNHSLKPLCYNTGIYPKKKYLINILYYVSKGKHIFFKNIEELYIKVPEQVTYYTFIYS